QRADRRQVVTHSVGQLREQHSPFLSAGLSVRAALLELADTDVEALDQNGHQEADDRKQPQGNQVIRGFKRKGVKRRNEKVGNEDAAENGGEYPVTAIEQQRTNHNGRKEKKKGVAFKPISNREPC